MNKYHEENIKAYNKMADNYNSTLDGKFTKKFKVLLLENMDINDNDSILDIGCGNGTLLSKMAKIKKINGFGTDISPQMIKAAKIRHPEHSFIVSGCEKTPYGDNSMDIITVCAAYHHFPDVNAFAAEAKRLLKPSGNLYIAEVYFPAITRNIANIFLPLLKRGDVKFYSHKEIVSTFSTVGFSLVKVVTKGHIQVVQLREEHLHLEN